MPKTENEKKLERKLKRIKIVYESLKDAIEHNNNDLIKSSTTVIDELFEEE